MEKNSKTFVNKTFTKVVDTNYLCSSFYRPARIILATENKILCNTTIRILYSF